MSGVRRDVGIQSSDVKNLREQAGGDISVLEAMSLTSHPRRTNRPAIVDILEETGLWLPEWLLATPCRGSWSESTPRFFPRHRQPLASPVRPFSHCCCYR